MAATKCLLNSMISTKNAKAMGVDIKNYYLNTPMGRAEYIFINWADIPDEIVRQYNLAQFVHNGKVYFKVTKGMYGLPQAGKLTNDRLQTHLAKHGYKQNPLVPGLFTHETNNVAFVLWVDDFLVKYTTDKEADHFIAALR